MIAIQIAASPHDLARRRVQAGRAIGAEMGVDAARFDRRRGRRIAVHHGDMFRIGRVEDLDLMDDLARFAVDADGEHFRTVGRGGGEPDLLVPNHRGRPAAFGNRRLPSDVFRLAPGDRQPTAGRVPVARRPAEFGPRFAGRGTGSQNRRREPNREESDRVANHCFPQPPL